MLCIAQRSNPQIAAVFVAPLVSESPIYMQGRVGPRIVLEAGPVTLFYVDSLRRGHTPPEGPKAAETKKDAKVIIEWQAGSTYLKRAYAPVKPGERFKIPDPYDPAKDIFITVEY